MSYKLTEETKQWIVSNYTAVGIIEAMEREGGEKALDIAKRLATKVDVLSELMTNPGRIKFVGDADVKPTEPVVEVTEPVVVVIDPVVEVIETVVEVTEPVVEVTKPVVEETKEVKPKEASKAKTTKKK